MNEKNIDKCVKNLRKKYSEDWIIKKTYKSFHGYAEINTNYHNEMGNVFRSIGWGLLEVLAR
jgi:hypothetical protein